ncbi:hypothetical protein Cgig2_003754 [Carnegiea gigantea]|uniref:Uncharacterized protein n=1 Tax=Carnegiea gigantea TaxID=171969 RepID=A0A9Q1K8H0_9CARY|nr:hypothetical protein Cgig2_003754 [Carnegiea gigantea]
MPLNHPFTGLAGLSTQLGTKLNPPLNILESSYVISQLNNFINYTTTQDNGNPSNGNQGDFGGLFDLPNDMNYNEFMGLLEEGNQRDISCFFNDDGFELANNMVISRNIQQGTPNTNQIVENPLVEQAGEFKVADRGLYPHLARCRKVVSRGRKMAWPYFDPEYENLSIRINPPRVSVDNSSCKNCTLVKVDSMNKPGILLEVVCRSLLTLISSYPKLTYPLMVDGS